ncbi:MAG TPA: hypothetical protein VML75_02210 [Kofleriaceae bacterium]|nr:hypothetical protein [Kofleriaceae bacterium]
MTCALPAAARAGDRGAATGAADAYERAQTAAIDRDHARAAELFELANALAPSPQALRSAARSRLAAGQRADAATHAATLIERYPDDQRSRALGNQLLAFLGPRLIRIDVRCAAACALEIDGRAAGATGDRDAARAQRWLLYVEPASHRLAARFEDGSEVTRRTFGGPGTELELRLAPPARPRVVTVPGSAAPTPLDRRWFALGVGATAVLSGAALWSWSDAHDARYDPRFTGQPSIVRGRERRTAALLGASLVAATATALLAIFTDWSGARGERPLSLGADATPGGALVGVGGAF